MGDQSPQLASSEVKAANSRRDEWGQMVPFFRFIVSKQLLRKIQTFSPAMYICHKKDR